MVKISYLYGIPRNIIFLWIKWLSFDYNCFSVILIIIFNLICNFYFKWNPVCYLGIEVLNEVLKGSLVSITI